MVLIVIPFLIYALWAGVETWLWRVILAAVVVLAWFVLGPAWIAVPVALIIGIAIKNAIPQGSRVK